MTSTCKSTGVLGLLLRVALGARAGLAQVGGGASTYGGNASGYADSAPTYGSNPSRDPRDPAANERAKRESYEVGK